MYLTPVALALALALTPALAASGPPATASTPTPETRALAEEMVSLGDERANATKALAPLERLLSGQIAIHLSITDPRVAAQVTQIVHDALSPVAQKAGDTLVEGYAANFSNEELRHLVAFLQSPAGQAEKSNLPLLRDQLAAAASASSEASKSAESGARAFAAASPQEHALVQRIFAAQDFEARTRRGYALTRRLVDGVAAQTGATAPATHAESDAKAADDYVRRVIEIEEGFYVTHYTEAQLAAIAAYLESEPAQALFARLPKMRQSMSAVVKQAMVSAISSLPEEVCAAAACTSDQRARLAEFMATMAAGVSRLPAFFG